MRIMNRYDIALNKPGPQYPVAIIPEGTIITPSGAGVEVSFPRPGAWVEAVQAQMQAQQAMWREDHQQAIQQSQTRTQMPIVSVRPRRAHYDLSNGEYENMSTAEFMRARQAHSKGKDPDAIRATLPKPKLNSRYNLIKCLISQS
jgi:hypothetical protein